MACRVVILPKAQMRLERYIAYTKEVLKNPTAARNIAKDARNTKKRLASMAHTLALCQDEELASLGYRTIHFAKYDFFMVYRIEGDVVYVDSMFHDLIVIDIIHSQIVQLALEDSVNLLLRNKVESRKFCRYGKTVPRIIIICHVQQDFLLCQGLHG